MIFGKVRLLARRSSRRAPWAGAAVRFGAVSLACVLWAGCGLAPPPQRPSSLGFASHGALWHGVRLPAGHPSYALARPQGDAAWATPALVRVLTEAADFVRQRYPGTAPLKVGDLSARRGGVHPRHGSHRTGRDADVLFYLADERGSSVLGSGFFRFDERGVSVSPTGAGGVRFFDTARNWALVRALLASEVPVQWLFCSAGVKARLLEYAAVHETRPEVITRASYVLHQPSYGNPHADHFHVRIGCTAEERALGCLDVGPFWPWWRDQHEKPYWPGEDRNDDASLLAALLSD